MDEPGDSLTFQIDEPKAIQPVGYSCNSDRFEFHRKRHGFQNPAFDFNSKRWGRVAPDWHGMDVHFHGAAWPSYSDAPIGMSGDEGFYRNLSGMWEPAWNDMGSDCWANAIPQNALYLRSETGGNGFFQTYPSNLQGVYVHMPTVSDSMDLRPFTGPSNTLVARFGMNCDEMTIPEGCAVQLKAAIVLKNVESGRRVEVTWNAASAGIHQSSPFARTFFDPNQGNHIVIGGRFGRKNGPPTLIQGTDIPIWSGHNHPSQSEPFGFKAFRVHMKWHCFYFALKHIAEKAGMEYTEDLVGEGWAAFENWKLRHVRFGLENYNPDIDNNRVVIRGSMRYFRIERG